MFLAIKQKKELFFTLSFLLALSVVENSLPRPIAFFRLGLVNMALLYAMQYLPLPSFFLLVILKSIFLSFLGGTLFSPLLLLSLSGSIVSSTIMLALFKIAGRYISFVAISVTGAIFHTISQVATALVLGYVKEITYLLPILILFSVFSGFIVGSIFVTISFDSLYAVFEKNMATYENNLSISKKITGAKAFMAYFIGALTIFSIVLFTTIKKPCILMALMLILIVFLIIIKMIGLSGFQNRRNEIFRILMRCGLSFFVLVLLNNIAPKGEIIWSCGVCSIGKSSFLLSVKKASVFVGLITISQIVLLTLKEFGLYPSYFETIRGIGKELVGKWPRMSAVFVGNAEKKDKGIEGNRMVEERGGIIASSKKKEWLLFFINLFIFLLFFIAKYAENRIELGCL